MIDKLFSIIGNVNGKNILLLQGPMGPFFKHLNNIFRKSGANVFTIGFNFSDYYFAYKKTYVSYKDRPENWGEFFNNFIKKYQINIIFLMGDCRFYHRVAIKVAKKNDIEIFVFEEGYLRPNFITLCKNGVNFYADIPKNSEFYLDFKIDAVLENEMISIKDFGSTYKNMAIFASAYYILANMFKFKYPHYVHHKDFSCIKEGYFGVLSGFKKLYFKLKERKISEKLEILHKQYFFVPLQVHTDFQLLEHSDYKNIEEFIEQILCSFATFAPKNLYIVFKHHPMDRGKKDYSNFISKISGRLNIKDRVITTYDIYLPTALKNALATITINSTVGISSLYHATPVICLGRSFYDIDGLTAKNIKLDDFWNNYGRVNTFVFKKFRAYLIKYTQINYNFY